MNFLLSDEQREMQRSVERFLQERCDTRRLLAAFDAPAPFDHALWRGLCDVGVAGIAVPSAFGGLGLEMIDLAIVAEVLGRAAAPVPFLGHALAGLALAAAEDPALHAQWLPRLVTGECLGTVAWAEPGGAWQPERWELALDGQGCLTGTKTAVPSAGSADLMVVGLRDGAMAVVERDAPGITVTAIDGVDRTRRLDAVRFDRTPARPIAGVPAARLRDAALVLLAADAFGGALRCVDMAVEHAKVREQFGRPIGSFQGLKHQIVDMAIEVEPARGLYWHAAHAWDHLPEVAAVSAALAKAHLGDRFLQAARDSVEAHGGIGYTWEFPLQVYLKRALFDHAWMGAPLEHRRRVAALSGW